MDQPTSFLLHPASRARRAAAARGAVPMRTFARAPEPDADEDVSFDGLLATARAHLEDVIALFGSPEQLAAQFELASEKRSLIKPWLRHLEQIVRMLVVMAALALLPHLPPADDPPRTSAAPRTNRTRAPKRRRRTLAIGVEPRPIGAEGPDAPSHPRACPEDLAEDLAENLPMPSVPEGAPWAILLEQITQTLADLPAAARRLARRWRRKGRPPRIAPADPPSMTRADGRYKPLSRKVWIVWDALCRSIDAFNAELETALAPPTLADDG